MYVKLNGEMAYLWRAIDHECEILESYVARTRDKTAVQRFRQMKSLQKFASVHANVHNHFSQERHLVDRQTYKARRSAALAEWQNLMA